MLKRILAIILSVVLMFSVSAFNASAKEQGNDIIAIKRISLTVKPVYGLKNTDTDKLIITDTEGVYPDYTYNTEFYEIDTRRYVEKLYAGNSYLYHIYLVPCEGYMIADDCEIIINNAELEDAFIGPFTDEVQQFADVSFSFKVDGNLFVKALRILHNLFYRLFKFY